MSHDTSGHESVYDGLVEDHGDVSGQWAFGTSFEDPLAGVDTTLPEGVDGADLAAYCLGLGDDALVLSHRLSQWCSRAPDLEDDIAVANIALDLLGQARLLLARAAAADPAVVPALPEGSPAPDEDRLAYFREAAAFRCTRLAELEHGDFAHLVVRLLLFSTARLALLHRLAASRDHVLAAIGAKGATEVTYHRDYAARWVVTLARGTEESRRRLLAALEQLAPWHPEQLEAHPVATRLAEAGVGVDPAGTADEVGAVLAQVLDEAHAAWPEAPPRAGVRGRAGRDGMHTEALGLLLAEMQVVARAHPLGRW
ncbi:ring-1,2-phenylacetyl-CoA epoxidase subunit PaaC [Nocardioides marinisabuli]|uniref:Ring-1,2-phenylacetyl-CoA epoxidase subunit PaaC n=1 Tax=Nocardioides marinisabuli TaxID=419476 RepID=A0A7Y9F0L5_9ACTN|nr:1,2-phenylacetyl-CoA epoxidase subunit PaaC [Nocardioides marinisabuli]NYD57432.1 ring-1,2-phenylacetyl-CoA epoxidase subunit PaaC [Nocardioides marinisabuli]